MNWLDISTYFMQNVIASATASFFFSCLFGLFWLGITIDTSFMEKFSQKFYCRLILGLTIIFTIIGSIPTHERILNVKISKIKNEIMTKDNMNKSMEHLERIMKKVECKYLECK